MPEFNQARRTKRSHRAGVMQGAGMKLFRDLIENGMAGCGR